MNLEAIHRSIVNGRGRIWLVPVRAGLRLLSGIYGAGVAIRNRRFDGASAAYRAAIPVISVGNITTGGTGKTPLVIEVARRFVERGRRVAVVARGYGGSGRQANDEMALIAEHCPEVRCVCNPDRVGAVKNLEAAGEADVVILDDGFQHRRLGRDLDIVCVDALRPFGMEHLLPRGLLREPLTSLSRADLFVVTRSDAVPQESLDAIERRIRLHSEAAFIIRARHAPVRVEMLDRRPDELPLDHRAVACFAGVGHPEAFARTVTSLGGRVVGCRWFADHHDYRVSDLGSLARDERFKSAERWFTTEKDAIKLRRLNHLDASLAGRIRVITVEIDFAGDGDRILVDHLDRVLNTK